MKKVLALCFIAVLIFTAGCTGSKKTSSGAPEAVVKGYYDALKNKKYETAYEYCKFSSPTTKAEFVQERKQAGMNFKEFTVGKATITGTKAAVPVTFKTGISTMPELTVTKNLEKGKDWKIIYATSGMGGSTGGSVYSPMGGSSGMGGMGGMGGTAPGTANPHGAGGSVPLNQ